MGGSKRPIEPGRDDRIIDVVSRAFDILRCFESSTDRLGNRDISARSGLPPSTVSRLTQTLVRVGQLAYLASEYRLGPGAMAISASMSSGRETLQSITPIIKEVAGGLPGLIGVAIPDGLHLVLIDVA